MRPSDVDTRRGRDRAAHDRSGAASQRGAGRTSGDAPAHTGGPGLTVELEPGGTAAAEARAALTVLDGKFDGYALDDVRLLVSELVTNSVRHAGAARSERVCLNVSSLGRTIRVEVSDGGCGFEPHARSKPRDEPGGWGLHLVDRIATRWGVQTGRRTRVWFEIDS